MHFIKLWHDRQPSTEHRGRYKIPTSKLSNEEAPSHNRAERDCGS